MTPFIITTALMTTLSVSLIASLIAFSLTEIYFISKMFKDEFGCFSLSSLLTGEWDSTNLKTGKTTHHVASVEISKHLVIIFVSVFAIALIFERI